MKRVAVITGGSSGIGLEIAKRFAESGYKVYELSRRQVQPAQWEHIQADISDDEQVKAAFEYIEKIDGCIDVLVNNAGFGISGAVEFTETDEALRLFNVNFFGAFRCICAAIPLMRKSGGGRIINVSSAAAVFSIPFQAFYSASKAALNSLTLALANELKAFGISVCAVMPGDVKTGFTRSRQKNHRGDDVYGGRIAKAVEAMERDEENGMSPEKIARDIFRIARKKRVKPLYTLGAAYKPLTVLQKILPVGFANRIVGMLYIKN